MAKGITRRSLLTNSAVAAVAISTAASAQDRPAPLAPDVVKDFVIAGHGNFEKVKQMLETEPRLLNACWDWGGGDFETALEGAGHMGNREIALYLIGKGARQNVFQAAMLGDLALVKAFLAAHPELRDSRGPHGIPLKVHAERGGEQAKGVLEFLQTVE
jgi:hypothetical protein